VANWEWRIANGKQQYPIRDSQLVIRCAQCQTFSRRLRVRALLDSSFTSRGKKPREAERREAHPTNVRAAPARVATCRRLGRGSAPQTSVRSLRNSSAFGRARVPALRCGTRQGERIRRWLSSRTALPETRLGGRYPLRPVRSQPSSSETGRYAGRSGTQSRPRALCETARGHRPCSAFRIASGRRLCGT
jgi:hypothetical protein